MKSPHENPFLRSSGSLVIKLGEPGHKLPGHFRMSLRDEKGPEDRWTLGVVKHTSTRYVAMQSLSGRATARLIPTPHPELAPKLASTGVLRLSPTTPTLT